MASDPMASDKGRIGRRIVLGGLAAAGPAFFISSRRARAATQIQLLSHRYPGLEFFANRMKTALPGVAVETRVIPGPQVQELLRIALSSGASSVDIMWCTSVTLPSYVKAGWLEPLDEYWAKHKEEFKLDDITASSIEACKVDGHLYALPVTTSTQLYAYRKDLLDAKGLQPPTSWDEAISTAKALDNPPRLNGVSMPLKWNFTPYELQSIMYVVGDGWFDKAWKSTVNTDRGLAAVETVKRLVQYCVPGYTAIGNDEHTVNLSQGLAAMGTQWVSRCAAMDDPARSKVVGKIAWGTPPGGKQAMVSDIYAIPKAGVKDKDLLFRLIAATLSEANQRDAAALVLPPRQAVLNDPELVKKYRWYPASARALAAAALPPAIPEFDEVLEPVCRRIIQAASGQMGVKAAMDSAAKEAEAVLDQHGYYKG